MKRKTLFTLLAICISLCFVQIARADVETWKHWDGFEPPAESTRPLEDSSPLQGGGGVCEIYDADVYVRVDSGDLGRIKVTIRTNYGPIASRSDDHVGYMDSYAPFSMQQVVTGDLYIRVRNKANPQTTTDKVYGIPLETRTPTTPGHIDANTSSSLDNGTNAMWYLRMTYLYGGSFDTANLGSATAEQIYGGTDILFATGTYEGYDNYIRANQGVNYPIPLPGEAVGLTDVIQNVTSEVEAGNPFTHNNYPTVLLDGTVQTNYTADVVWNDTTKIWSIGGDAGFLLPPNAFDPTTEYLDVWWSMLCANDVVRIDTNRQADDTFEVPLPGSALLCGIGLGFAALVGRVVRRARRS